MKTAATLLLLMTWLSIGAEIHISDLPETNAVSATAIFPINDPSNKTWKIQKGFFLGANLTNWAKLNTNAAGGSQVWTNSPTGTATLSSGVTNILITGDSAQWFLATNYWVGDSTAGIHLVTVLSGTNTLLQPYQIDILDPDGSYTGGDVNGLFIQSLVNGTTNSFGSDPLAISPIYFGFANYALTITVDSFDDNPTVGSSSGTFIQNNGNHQENFAIIGRAWGYNNNTTNVAIAGNYSRFAGHTGMPGAAGYFQVGGSTRPLIEDSVVLLDNRDTGVPLLIGRTNNGTTTFSVASSGLTSAKAGFSSTATDSFLVMTSTGKTNTLGKNATARFSGTNVTYVVKDNAGTPVFTNAVAVGNASEHLQTSGAIMVTSGTIVGTVAPE